MKTSTLWLRNTSRYPDFEVWPLINAAYKSVKQSLRPDQEMPKVIVNLTNCSRAYRGRAYWIEEHYTNGSNAYNKRSIIWHRILIRVGAPDKFPRKVRYPTFKSDMPEYSCRTYREAIMMVAAHEIEHCLGTSGRQSGEFRCEMAAWDAIDYFRKHQVEIKANIAAGMKRSTERSEARMARIADSRRPEVRLAAKIEKIEMALTKWHRKSKLATNKVKKYSKALARYQKKLRAGTSIVR